MSPPRRSLARSLAPAALLLVLVACGGSGSPGVTGPAGQPSATVERFLDAVADDDLEAMGRIFGTADGPYAERSSGFGCAMRWLGSFFLISSRCPDAQEVELRMDALARVLENDGYEVTGEGRVAGREDPTRRVDVTMVRGGETVEDVPFVTVQSGDGVWYVLEVDVEHVTGASERR